MPSSSEKQRKYVYYLRNKYKSKSKAPEKYKWAFDDEWLKLKKEDCEYIIPYVSKFEEMSPPNVSLILHKVHKAIDEMKRRMKSDREHKDYFLGYIDYLNSYLNGDINPGEVAEMARNKSDIYDDSSESGKVDASHYIMKIVRDSIKD